MSYLYNTFVYEPLYNGLVFLLSILPHYANAGIAIIIFTILVKLILFPLSKASIKSQIKMKELQPKMDELKEKYKNNKQEQSVRIMNLYKDNKLNPFSGIFLLLIQFPIIIALYTIFAHGGLPSIRTEILYSFVPSVASVDMHFLGINLAEKSLILALIVAVSQYFQIKLTLPKPKKTTPSLSGKNDMKADMMHSMQTQMQYVLPILIFVIAYPFPPISNVFPHLPAALVLYWVVSNLFMIGQEIFVRRRMLNK
ncbi:MAG: YidC/Oxa1 family membrane protein insertase [Candidatus Taylorbacteria bacterium]